MPTTWDSFNWTYSNFSIEEEGHSESINYRDAAPAAMIGASNHFEVDIATANMPFRLSSGAVPAAVVGVLIEVPVMLMPVKICLKTTHWFRYVPAVA